jgi:hypothetical protein
MEFMSLGVPVVASSTRIDRFYFDDSVVRFFESGNVDALATAMLDVLRNRELRQQMVANAVAYAQRHSWQLRKTDYLQLVDELIETGSAQDRNASSAPARTQVAARAITSLESPNPCQVAAQS